MIKDKFMGFFFFSSSLKKEKGGCVCVEWDENEMKNTEHAG